ncbi:lipocalin family protein [Dyella sp.]|uniref:lipocalin family protein n=1 Tax=Dyella sp. TaxID=1869338 RepID=UPI002ED0E567
MRPPFIRNAHGLMLAAALLGGCAADKPVTHVPHVDVARYMGDWYVIASIPSFPERHAFNAIESYRQDSDGRIETTFRYRSGSFDAPVKTMHPVGKVRPGSGNAIWGMQFIWPIQAEYVIAYLDDSYSTVIVARSKRDYVWIMARTPSLPEASYTAMVQRVASLGYDVTRLRKVPQQWPEIGQP